MMEEAEGGRVISGAEYNRLLNEIRGLLDGTEERGKEGRTAVVMAYWKIGRQIEKAGLTGRGHYGDSVMEELAKDLDVNAKTLRASVVFQRVYKWNGSVPNLSWSSIRALVAVKDAREREYYRGLAEKGGWGSGKLLAAMEAGKYEREVLKQGPARKGLARPGWAGHVYKARVKGVVDGDTVDFYVDLGFNVWLDQKVRLAKVDAAAGGTVPGKAAFEAVRDRLAKAGTIVLKTEKDDIYGRMVAHVFYAADEGKDVGDVFEDGRYLNGDLVAEGLLKRV